MPLPTEMIHGASDIDRVSVNNGTHDQVQPGRSEGLALEGAVADFATLVEEHGSFELVSRSTPVESRLALSSQGRVGVPFDT
jgi:hypothetical protein